MKRRLPAGDYAVEYSGTVVAAVERKSLDDLAGSLMSGKLTYALAELSALPRAGLVVEDRYSALFKLKHVPGGQIADALAEAQVRFPAVTIMFAETRPLAQEWTYRFLGAALAEYVSHVATAELESTMACRPCTGRTPDNFGDQGLGEGARLDRAGQGPYPCFCAGGSPTVLGRSTRTGLRALTESTPHGVLSGPPPLASADRARDCGLAKSADWGTSGRRPDAEQTVVDAVWSMTSRLLRCRTEPPTGNVKGAFCR